MNKENNDQENMHLVIFPRARFCFDSKYEWNFAIVDKFAKLGFKISITDVTGLMYPHVYIGSLSLGLDSPEEINEFNVLLV